MRNVLLALLFSASLLGAQEAVAKKDCAKVTASFKMMSEGTKINHKNITMYAEVLDSASASKEEKNRARKLMEDMNQKTADRALNSQYPAMYEEMKEAYVVNCGSFTAENNGTISGLIERSIDFNNIMAKTLGDELSLSKVK
jgi:hypothetical protein